MSPSAINNSPLTMITIRFLLPGLLLLGGSTLLADDSAPHAPEHAPADAPQAPHEVRKNVHFRRLDVEHGEMETVTFLGVETSPISKALVAQLSLSSDAGLVVQHIVPNTAAAEVLKPYDILLKLDDQILIDQHQLSVLIRNHAAGDEVTLTYLRAGKTATAKVKLSRHEVPKIADTLFSLPGRLPFQFAPETQPGEPADREHAERMLSMIDRAHHGEPVRVEIQHGRKGEGMRAVKINTENSNLVYSDDNGSLELTIKDGKKMVVAKNAKGEQEFAGPATTDEERKHIPEKVRARLDKLESMHNVSFRTDDDFETFETEVAPPAGKGVRLIVDRAVDVPVLAM